MWIRAEEDYGLVRPEPGETMIALHRQTSQRLAHAPDTWDETPVHVEMPPEAILSDIAYGYNDIRANWEDAMGKVERLFFFYVSNLGCLFPSLFFLLCWFSFG